MRLLDLTLPTPEENLALDEALLEAAEASELECGEVLRLWESATHAVVVGRNTQVAAEVDAENCRTQGIPILRRTSGGASVIIGPGCLMYSLVLDLDQRPHLRAVDQCHGFVLGAIAAALSQVAPGIARQGTSDLAVRERKVSGNSCRYRRRHLLYHGTLLYAFDLSLLQHCLKCPPRQPEYRCGRDHGQFVENLSVDAATLRSLLRTAWSAQAPLASWPQAGTRRLAEERYSQRDWNWRR
jgi:lipoate-protein ligase A